LAILKAKYWRCRPFTILWTQRRLGLAICHGILAAMGAEIQLVNVVPLGCTATVILPT